MLCHIFKTGEHTDSNGNKRVWTISDLDKICYQFKNVHSTVPICVGHPISNSPAYGWIDKVLRKGNDLYCSFKNVNNQFKEAIKQGLFKNRSISLDEDLNIRHIAFLGGQAPAIKGLEEFCFADNGKTFTTYELIQNKEDFMDDNFESQLKMKDDLILKLQNQIKASEKEKKLKEFQDFADLAVKDGHILPKHKEYVINILQACDNAEKFNFSDSGSKSGVDAVKEFITSLKRMEFSDIATKNNSDKKSFETNAKAISGKLKKIMQEDGIDLVAAYEKLNA